MHNIKEGHDVKASVGDTLVNYAEAFKKTKTAETRRNKKNDADTYTLYVRSHDRSITK
jgi:hypothetical protein